ncbi:MAG: autotransporter-associated beta strand repeat-containing protein [Terrimicrobiaceae bacterium]|nr:autotransporter-associated beta strand repeat-containing protein [Terrimicrobiaceae bacterium]
MASFASGTAQAAYIFWDGTTPAGWDAAGNWSTVGTAGTPDPGSPPGAADIAVFSTNVAGNLNAPLKTVNLNADQAVQGLIFGNISPAFGTNSTPYTLLGGGTDRTLTIGSGGIQYINPLGAVTIGSATAGQKVNVALNGSQTWTNYNSSGSNLTIVNNVTNTSAVTPLTLTVAAAGAGGGSNTIFNGVISDGGGVGTIALTVATRSGTSAGGSVILTGANTYTGATTVKAGQLQLDFSVSAPASIVSSSSGLVLGGGSLFSLNTSYSNINESYSPFLNLKASVAGTNTQAFNGTTLNAGHSTVVLTANGASTLTANLGAITRNANSTLNLSANSVAVPATFTAPAATVNIVKTSNANDATGILGTWASVGTGTNLDYATVSGGNIIANGASATDGTAGNLSNVTSATTNYKFAAAATQTGAITGNTLRYTGAAATLANGGFSTTLNGLMNAGTGALTVSGSGNLVIGSSNELVLTTNNQSVTISAPISGAAGAGITVTQIAPYNTDNRNVGFTLGGASTYTGTTNINYGYLYTVAGFETPGVSGNLGNGGNITFNGGVLGLQNRADYSARIKNSTSAIALHVAGQNTVYNSPLDSSNIGGLTINSLQSAGGQITLNAANTFIGDTILGSQAFNVILGNKAAFSTGTVYLNNSGAFSASTDLTGANKIANNVVYQSNGLDIKGNKGIEFGGTFSASGVGQATLNLFNDLDGAALTLSGNVYLSSTTATANTIFLNGRGTTNITGVISNNAADNSVPTSFTASGTGTTNLSAANTYTGSTFVANGGTLNLDFSATGAPTTNILSSSAAGTQFNGGTLKLTGKDNTSNSQTVASTALNAGSSRLVMAPGGGTGEVVLNLGGINNGVAGSALDITLSGTSSATNGVTTTSGTDAGGLIRRLTVNGNDWATKGGSNIVAYSAYTDDSTVGSANWIAANNITNTTAGGFTGSLASAATINSLRFNNDVAGGPNLGSQTLTVPDGILVTSAVNNKALTITSGNLQGSSGATGDLIVINRGAGGTTLDIGATIQNNGAGPTGLTKAGAGLVSLSGTNTYTGATVATEGVLKLSSANALPGGIGAAGGLSNLFFRGGVIGLTADFTRGLGTGVTQVQWNGGSGGFAAYGADRFVNLGGASAAVTWASGSFVANGASLILGASSADAMVDFQNPIALGGAVDRTVQVDNGSAAIDAKISGIISGTPTGGFVKTGAGALWLSAANTYNGETLVLDGTLTVSGTGSLSTLSSIHVNGANAIFDLGNNHANLNTSNAFNGVILENGSITGTGTSVLTGAFYNVQNGSISAILAGGASATLTKTTSGTVTLSGANTYTGATTISAGTLAVNGSLTSAVTVTAGTLQGIGSTTGTVTVGNSVGSSDSFLAPGNSVGTFTTTQALSLNSDATYVFELNSSLANSADKVVANGVTISGASFSFTDLNPGSAITPGTVFTIIDNTGGAGISGTFSNLADGSNFSSGNYNYGVSYSGGTGNDLTLTASAVPEPGTYALGMAGLLALVVLRRRRRAAQGF